MRPVDDPSEVFDARTFGLKGKAFSEKILFDIIEDRLKWGILINPRINLP